MLPALVSLLVLTSLLAGYKRLGIAAFSMEWFQLTIIFALVAFGLYVALSRWKSRRRGEPLEDEFTVNVMRKASSISYFISLYIWVIILIMKDRVVLDMEVWIGTGILLMGASFVLIWLLLSGKGMRHDQ